MVKFREVGGIIRQGYESAAMKRFNFIEQFNISQIEDKTAPAIVFGMYKADDVRFVNSHKGDIVVVLSGLDAKKGIYRRIRKPVMYASWFPQIVSHMVLNGYPCTLLKLVMPTSERNTEAITRGESIYTYLGSNGRGKYLGKDTINKLNLTHPLIIGRLDIERSEWITGESDKIYSNSFIGLFLSDFVGGGNSIIEMGLRGIRCVTNVLDLPCCIPWETTSDIENAIWRESKRIGTIDNELSESVKESLIDNMDGFDLDILRV